MNHRFQPVPSAAVRARRSDIPIVAFVDRCLSGLGSDRDVYGFDVVNAVKMQILKQFAVNHRRRFDCDYLAQWADGTRSKKGVIANVCSHITEDVARSETTFD